MRSDAAVRAADLWAEHPPQDFVPGDGDCAQCGRSLSWLRQTWTLDDRQVCRDCLLGEARYLPQRPPVSSPAVADWRDAILEAGLDGMDRDELLDLIADCTAAELDQDDDIACCLRLAAQRALAELEDDR